MTKATHRAYISFLSLIVVIAFFALLYYGYSYYHTPLAERYFNENHQVLKPSGEIGHGIGILGSLLIIIGVSSYMARKRYRFMARWGTLKYWLEFHIFLCTLGPILILYHTAFKFGGIVAISFWSMVAVFLSGIIGRFIYIQIPRTIEGRELSLNEVREMKNEIKELILQQKQLDDESIAVIKDSLVEKPEANQKESLLSIFKKYFRDRKKIGRVRRAVRKDSVSRDDRKKILGLVKNEISLSRRIERLNLMQNLFKYWHVAHLPFALVMLVIMVIHVVVTIIFGYRWIF